MFLGSLAFSARSHGYGFVHYEFEDAARQARADICFGAVKEEETYYACNCMHI